jgi:hypothetical protein
MLSYTFLKGSVRSNEKDSVFKASLKKDHPEIIYEEKYKNVKK